MEPNPGEFNLGWELPGFNLDTGFLPQAEQQIQELMQKTVKDYEQAAAQAQKYLDLLEQQHLLFLLNTLNKIADKVQAKGDKLDTHLQGKLAEAFVSGAQLGVPQPTPEDWARQAGLAALMAPIPVPPRAPPAAPPAAPPFIPGQPHPQNAPMPPGAHAPQGGMFGAPAAPGAPGAKAAAPGAAPAPAPAVKSLSPPPKAPGAAPVDSAVGGWSDFFNPLPVTTHVLNVAPVPGKPPAPHPAPQPGKPPEHEGKPLAPGAAPPPHATSAAAPAPQEWQAWYSCLDEDVKAVERDDLVRQDILEAYGYQKWGSLDAKKQALAEIEVEQKAEVILGDCIPEDVDNEPDFPIDECAGMNVLEVGSKAWCDTLDDLMAKFSRLGKWFARKILLVDLDTMQPIPPKARGSCAPQIDTSGKLAPAPAPNANVNPLQKLIRENWTNIALGSAATLNPTTVANPLIGVLTQMTKKVLASTLDATPLDCDSIKEIVASFDVGAIAEHFQSYMQKAWLYLVKCTPCNIHLVLGLTSARALSELFEGLGGDVLFGINFCIETWVKIKVKFPLGIRPVKLTIDYLLNYVCPVKIPSEGEIIEAAVKDAITEDHARCLLKMHGYSPFLLQMALTTKTERLPWRELIEFHRRHPEMKLDLDDDLKDLGMWREDERTAVKDLYDEIPNIQDHLMWLRRNVFDLDFVKDFKLLEGFDTEEEVEKITEELKKETGAIAGKPNFWKTFGKDLRVKGLKKIYAAFHFAAHWLPVPRETGAEMVQRLRPGRVSNQLQFTTEQYKRTLIEQDVMPSMLDRYIALSYNLLTTRFIKTLYFNSTINKAELIERWQDLGYTLKDSQLVADAYEIDKRRTRAGQAHGFTAEKVVKLYREGAVGTGTVVNKFGYLGFTKEEAEEAIEVVKMEREAEIQQHRIKNTHKCYMTGKVNLPQAQQALIGDQVEPDYAKHLVSVWYSERACNAHDVTEGQLVKLLKDGLIDQDAFVANLLRLDYTPGAISALLVLALYDIELHATQTAAKRAAKAQALQIALKRQIQQQLVKQQRAKQQQAKAFAAGVKQKAAKQKKLAKVKLDLHKAELHAADILAKAHERIETLDTKAQAKTSKPVLTSSDKHHLATVLTDIKGRYRDELALLQANVKQDVAPLKDKVAKAQIHAQYVLDKADLEDRKDKEIEAAKASVTPSGVTKVEGADSAVVKEQEKVIKKQALRHAADVEILAGESAAVGRL